MNSKGLAHFSIVTCVTVQKHTPDATVEMGLLPLIFIHVKLSPDSGASFLHWLDYWFRPGDEPNEILKYFKCVKEDTKW